MLQSNNFHEEELARNRELDYPAGFGHGDLKRGRNDNVFTISFARQIINKSPSCSFFFLSFSFFFFNDDLCSQPLTHI